MSIFALTIGICMAACAPITAQDFGSMTSELEARETSYYQQPVYRPNTLSIIHEKAQVRAAQRQARLASLNWYGMSNSRPQAASTPFTSRYSPVWEMPGGKPYSWHPTYQWPGYAAYVR